jgi:hypothetical protein
MVDFQNEYIRGKSLEELIDGLIDRDTGMATALPGSVVHEVMKIAIQAKMVEQIAKPQKWAGVAIGAAVVSALAAVASSVAAFA